TALAMADATIPVYVAIYLLPLRHPTLVARQVADLDLLAPGRLILGVGVGGEDPHEYAVCGGDPRTRGRRMDGGLQGLRALLSGRPVTSPGQFFARDAALLAPPPRPPVPLIVGGRPDAAVRRAAPPGGGGIGLWTSARRYADVVASIDEQAAAAGRTDHPRA